MQIRDCFQDSDFAGDLEDSKSTSGGVLCIFGSRTFVPISWTCKKQTSVSHSSTEAEIISLDADSLGFGDWSVSFRTEQNRWTQERELLWNPSAGVEPNMHNPIPIKHTNVIPTSIDHIPSNTTHSDSGAMLYVFEDNEAVIKMIVKGRSPTMRHVARTHRVALDWLFDRINLDQKNRIRYIETRHQLADILTKGNFTTWRMEQSSSFVQYQPCQLHLLYKEFQLDKLLHDGEEDSKSKDERVVSKSRPAVMNMSSFFLATSSSAASSPIASKKSGDADSFRETRKQDERKLRIRRSVEFSSATQGCIFWRVDGRAAGDSVASRRRKFRRLSNPAAGTWYFKEEFVAETIKLGRTPLHTEPVLQLTRKSKEYGSDMGRPSAHIAGHIALYGSRLLQWSGRSMENHLAILWKIWMCFGLFGECSWILLFEQQFISEKTMTRSWDLWRIISGKQQDSFSGKRTSWSVVRQKPLAWAWLISKIRGGCRQAYCTI